MNSNFQYTPDLHPSIHGRDRFQKIHVHSDYVDDAITFLKNEHIDTIRISRCRGYKADNIDFILNIDNLRGLEICDVRPDIDLSAIEKCTNIRYLMLSEEVKKTVNLSSLPHLEFLIMSPTRGWKLPSPEACKYLKYFDLWHYRGKTLQELPHYQNLEILRVFHGSVLSLDGLERFHKLRVYEHYYGKKLWNISALTKVPNLEEIVLNHCKKMEIKNTFEQCEKLKTLKYFDCPNLPSLSFLKKMKNLEFFSFSGIDIEDGDVTPLLKLKYFGFYPNKRHYSHTCEELEKMQQKEN
jgi:hypothetical protein